MKVVLDTNVLISGLRFDGPPRRILDWCARGTVEAIVSDSTLRETERVLLDKFHLTANEMQTADATLRDLLSIEHSVTILDVPQLRDPHDVHVLAAAKACQPDAIITGDKDLLVLEAFSGIPILSAGGFIQGMERTTLTRKACPSTKSGTIATSSPLTLP